MLRTVGGVCWRDLRGLEELLLDLAARHRDTLICGRTPGQPGAPATFGWKAATWATKSAGISTGCATALRAGSSASSAAASARSRPSAAGLAIRESFCAELGLADPVISWLATRDRIAEFGNVLAMIAGTLARFGTEVYELQRPEIGELGEPRASSVVGSITMHHKRNPEGSEHLATLARLVRVNAGVLVEGLVGEHERDGRTWKSEWPALPEVCLLTAQALQLAISLAEGLEVHEDRMAANLAAYLGSTQNPADPGAAPQMVDMVILRARQAREREPERWP